MLTAAEIMTKNPVAVKPGDKISEAAAIMLERHFNGLPVVDNAGKLVGVICQSDLVAQQKKLPLPSFFVLLDSMIPLQFPKKFEEQVQRMAAVLVEQAMNNQPRVVSPDTPLDELATLMADAKHYTLPVVENEKLVGVVGKEDVLRTLVKN